jgi:hypothetical protein
VTSFQKRLFIIGGGIIGKHQQGEICFQNKLADTLGTPGDGDCLEGFRGEDDDLDGSDEDKAISARTSTGGGGWEGEG